MLKHARSTVARRAIAACGATACALLVLTASPREWGSEREVLAVSQALAASPGTHYVLRPVRLSRAFNIVLEKGTISSVDASGSAVGSGAVTRLLIEAPVLSFDVATRNDRADGTDAGDAALEGLIGVVQRLSFEALSIRHGTLIVHMGGNTRQTFQDVDLELTTPRRKGPIIAKGSALLNGQRLTLETTIGAETGKGAAAYPIKATLKSAPLEADFEGAVRIPDGLQLDGRLELKSQSLDAVAHWFGSSLGTTQVLRDFKAKGKFAWASRTLTFEKVALTVDGNDATGSLSLALNKNRPVVDATLALRRLDLTRHVELFGRRATEQRSIIDGLRSRDRAKPIFQSIDADIRLSAEKVVASGLEAGNGALTIGLRSGKVLADIAELNLQGGTVSGQISLDSSLVLPVLAIRGRAVDVEISKVLARFVPTSPLHGKATASVDLLAHGVSNEELLNSLGGKISVSMRDGARVWIEPLREMLSKAEPRAAQVWSASARSLTRAEEIDIRLAVRSGVVMAEALQVRTGDVLLTGSGRLSLPARHVDMAFDVMKARPDGATVAGADQGSRLLLQGPLAWPQLRLDMLTGAIPTERR